MHLLIVEDDPRLQALLRRLLGEDRHVVDVVGSGAEAVEIAGENRGIDAVILDVGLTAVGIAIGIAAMVAVLGVSESSRAGLLAQLDRLGTNLLTVSPGQTLFGENSTLPFEARPMIARIGPVQATAATTGIQATVRRTDRIPAAQTGGIAVVAATTICSTQSAAPSRTARS